MRDPRLDQALTSVFTSSNEQMRKVSYIGKVNYVVSFYEEGMVLQVNNSPLVVTFHADLDSNTGEILELWPAVEAALGNIKRTVAHNRLITYASDSINLIC
eukprot:GHVQ01020173.1.p1 GENE.GHVQ01020173.1~~GHVQ01020173.1.p1  ORF type:complete len:101 (+),score=8.11 GHVQ01020173.1:1069-1371(+)